MRVIYKALTLCECPSQWSLDGDRRKCFETKRNKRSNNLTKDRVTIMSCRLWITCYIMNTYVG